MRANAFVLGGEAMNTSVEAARFVSSRVELLPLCSPTRQDARKKWQLPRKISLAHGRGVALSLDSTNCY